MVHHLPRLRSYFAEFLRYCCLNRFSIRCQPTCVGFRYGAKCLPSFLHQWPHSHKTGIRRAVVPKTIGGKLLTHRLKLSLFCVKLSKRPYQKLKDYLIIVKPWVKTTVVRTLLFVTYVSIGEAVPDWGASFFQSRPGKACSTTNKIVLFRCFGGPV